MLAGLVFTLLFTGGASVCNKTYRELIKHLNLNQNKDLFLMIRPAKNYTQPTDVGLDMQLYAILDVWGTLRSASSLHAAYQEGARLAVEMQT